ncbi:MAG: hypothetical protein JSS07_00615 [Proteobacteria bacterium]|nr:hypothetical protein [Pseudomonadota bacterium]
MNHNQDRNIFSNLAQIISNAVNTVVNWFSHTKQPQAQPSTTLVAENQNQDSSAIVVYQSIPEAQLQAQATPEPAAVAENQNPDALAIVPYRYENQNPDTLVSF